MAIQRWSVSGITEIEKLTYTGLCLETNKQINAEAAETLASSVLHLSEPLRTKFNQNELSVFGDAISSLFDKLSHKYSTFIEEHALDLRDKVNFQLKSLERHEAAQRDMINNVIQKQKDIFDQSRDMDVKTKCLNVVRLWEGRLNKLHGRISEKKTKIDSAMNFTSEAEDVAAVLIQVS